MNKTKIEWCDYTANPIKGKCKMGCHYCYATRMYDRFKWNPMVTLDRREFGRISTIKPAPSKIFLCSTHELFGKWIPTYWIKYILESCRGYPYHIFQILTKCPARAKDFDFPSNIWFGISITGQESKQEQIKRFEGLMSVKAEIHFISFEPFLAMPVNLDWDNIDWAIFGAQTQPTILPKRQWIDELEGNFWVRAIPVFMKNNLKPLMGKELKQEFPR